MTAYTPRWVLPLVLVTLSLPAGLGQEAKSPLNLLDPARLPPEEKFAWQPKELVAVLVDVTPYSSRWPITTIGSWSSATSTAENSADVAAAGAESMAVASKPASDAR